MQEKIVFRIFALSQNDICNNPGKEMAVLRFRKKVVTFVVTYLNLRKRKFILDVEPGKFYKR